MFKQDTRSYAQQFADIKHETDLDVLNTAHPKPSRSAQSKAPGAKRMPFTSDIYVRSEQRPLALAPRSISKEALSAKLKVIYAERYLGFILLHVFALFVCPLYFSWRNLGLGMLVWSINIIGINFSFHRQLTHKSFKSPKWLEYFAAWCGTLGVQGGPIEWVSRHRYHHLHTDTPLDPHSPYEGFWWSHMGWLVNYTACSDRTYMDFTNCTDLTSQWFYRALEASWYWQMVVRFLITQFVFGTEATCWTLAWPVVWGWHITFLVNSASHLWGYRPYETGDLSTNCWWVALVAAGEGWHNTHHAFPFSARHGLEWWEVDITYILIRTLQAFGIVWDVQLPTEKQKAAKRVEKASGCTTASDSIKQTLAEEEASDEASDNASSAEDLPSPSSSYTSGSEVDVQALVAVKALHGKKGR